ncbi:transposase [Pseudomonas sp. 21LCFQ010]|uniref:REP-associated tyrosine transposase n=1 Tax=unclassified Pseudomonas TaxID=196821 RepID=UPI0004F84871|nr:MULTISPECIES: transposase [unclassified Pseudomonas]MCO8162990.1 transposase [Pseudomonas sp. 21LCFQ010]BAP41143.1 putative uncharacterized protein [Pseudomonas sp. StFLB209]
MSGRFCSGSLRRGRVSISGQVYLVTTVTLGRSRLFNDWRLGRLVVAELRHAQDLGLVRSLAWVVMPDHLHWMFELRSGTLTQVMRRVKSRSAIALNRAIGGQGCLWQEGFHDKALRREEELLDTARYIIANPLRAGLVRTVSDYPLWDAVWL